MLFVFTWASTSSHTSRGASEHSAAHSPKLERNPWGTAPISNTLSDHWTGRAGLP